MHATSPAPRGRALPIPPFTAARGFTLIELLTVIAIIGILAAIIIPVAGKVRAVATKATCASNLRQLISASLLFAQDNKSQLPTRDTNGLRDTSGHAHAYPQADFKLFRTYLGIPASNREASTILFCPGPVRQTINSSGANYSGNNGQFIGYNYYNLKKLGSDIFTGYGADEAMIRRADRIPPRFPLWGCVTIDANGSFIAHADPRVTTGFSGQNVAYADGSVRWHKGSDLIPFSVEGLNTYYGPRP